MRGLSATTAALLTTGTALLATCIALLTAGTALRSGCGPTTAAASSTTVSTTAIPATVATTMATTMSVAVGICGACRTRLLYGCHFNLANRLGQTSRIKVLTRDLQADQTLDVAQQAVLVLTHQ